MTVSYTRHASNEVDRQPVAIQSVNTETREAMAITRVGTMIKIDCRYAVGESFIIPAVGEQWYIERYDAVWRLSTRIPFNDETLLIEAEEGQVSIGSQRGPLELNGDRINVNADLVMSGTHYRSSAGELQKRDDDGSWVPVIPASGQAVLSTDISDSSGLGRSLLQVATAPAARSLIGAGTYVKPESGIPNTDLSASVQASLIAAGTALQTVGTTDIYDTTSLGRSLMKAASAEAARAVLNIGTGVTVASNDIADSTAVGRAVLTAVDQAAARAAIGAATTSGDITDSTPVGRSVLTAATASDARTAIGAGTYSKPGSGIPASDLATGRVTSVDNGTASNFTIWRGSQAQYDNIATKDPNTLYVVVVS